MNISTLCGNIEKYEQIKIWIEKQISDKSQNKLSLNNFIFVTGNSGIGKTYSIKYICDLLNLYTIYISTHNCASSEELKDLLIKNITSSLIQILTNNNKQKIIIIDEFESMMAIDKTFNTTLLNILTEGKLKKIPIICISSPEIIKKIGVIKKKCEIIELKIPTDKDIIDILSKKYISKDKKYLENIILNSNGNISQCIKKIENQNSKQFDIIDKVINIHILYNTNDFDRNYIRRIILSDPWLIPLKFHENLISELSNRKCPINKLHVFYKTFLEYMIVFDKCMNKNDTNISSDIFTSMIHSLSLLPKKNKTESKIDNFTKILSYLSLQKKYMKKSYSEKFPLYQIGNYHTNIIGRNFIFFN